MLFRSGGGVTTTLCCCGAPPPSQSHRVPNFCSFSFLQSRKSFNYKTRNRRKRGEGAEEEPEGEGEARGATATVALLRGGERRRAPPRPRPRPRRKRGGRGGGGPGADGGVLRPGSPLAAAADAETSKTPSLPSPEGPAPGEGPPLPSSCSLAKVEGRELRIIRATAAPRSGASKSKGTDRMPQ